MFKGGRRFRSITLAVLAFCGLALGRRPLGQVLLKSLLRRGIIFTIEISV